MGIIFFIHYKDNVIWIDFCSIHRMIHVSKYLVPKGYNAITIFPIILVKDRKLRDDKVLINHESIHLKQQLELLIVPFYVLYVAEFTYRLLSYTNWEAAYRNLSFEREAYANEKDLAYLKTRPFWNVVNYIFK